jgi:hypothetical protein
VRVPRPSFAGAGSGLLSHSQVELGRDSSPDDQSGPMSVRRDTLGPQVRGGGGEGGEGKRHLFVIPRPGVPGERSLLAGVERSGGICFSKVNAKMTSPPLTRLRRRIMLTRKGLPIC